MTYETHKPLVTFKAFGKDNSIFKDNYICFSNLNSKIRSDIEFKKIDYFARVRSSLKKSEVNKYVKFIKQLLDENKFKVWVYPFKKKKVFYSLNSDGMGEGRVLLYLTLFRYMDDFPEIVKQFTSKMTNGLEENYNLFVEIHRHFIGNAGDGLSYNNLSGHGAMCSYNPQAFKPKSFTAFQKNLDKNLKSAQSYFVDSK